MARRQKSLATPGTVFYYLYSLFTFFRSNLVSSGIAMIPALVMIQLVAIQFVGTEGSPLDFNQVSNSGIANSLSSLLRLDVTT